MTERLTKSVLYTYGVADMFLLLMLSQDHVRQGSLR